MEGGGVLLHGQVDQAQVVQDFPVKRRQVVSPLQTAEGLWDGGRRRSQRPTALRGGELNNARLHRGAAQSAAAWQELP